MSASFSVKGEELKAIAQGLLEAKGRATASINFIDSVYPLTIEGSDVVADLNRMTADLNEVALLCGQIYKAIAREAFSDAPPFTGPRRTG